ncbi:S-layer homology domain-containing protein [Bacillus sp. FJAT-45350]|uniref:S-layer homology domain-containing protein n=1 Tax=Bacillus sp. FJAT-45350 TaxID=2011014 RepID=UPI000BB8C880|nr:S-layer homology domain-containing protein [Bacillus sp. FJAT-45350]
MKKLVAVVLASVLALPVFGTTGFADFANPSLDAGLNGPTQNVSEDVEVNSTNGNYTLTIESSLLRTTSNLLDLEFSIEENDGGSPVNSVTTVDATGKKFDATEGVSNFRTGLSRSGNYKMTLNVNEGEDQIELNFQYYHMNNPGAKFLTEYSDRRIEAFNREISMEFGRSSFLVDGTSTSAVAPNQEVLFQVGQKPQSTNNLTFISNQIKISDVNGNVGAVKPSRPGTLTIEYDVDLPSSVAKHNVTIAKNINGEWIPVGGVVDSRRSTVTTTISDFGTYAATLNYQTFGLPNESWYQPYVLGLAYKGVIVPQRELPRFTNDFNTNFSDAVNEDIKRLDFAAMTAKAMGWMPVEYNAHFADVVEEFKSTTLTIPTGYEFNSNSTSDTIQLNPSSVGSATIAGSATSGDVITINVPNGLSGDTQTELESAISNIPVLGSPSVTTSSNQIVITLGNNHQLNAGDNFTIGSVVTTKLGNTEETDYYGYDVLGYLMTAVNNGLLQGVGTDANGQNIMDPDNILTRQEAAIFVSRALKLRTNDIGNMERINRTLVRNYSDVADIAPWARPYVEAVTRAGIMQGTGGKFEPKGANGTLTIAQASTMIYRIMETEGLFGR